MYKELKPMLTPSELVAHLESKGIKFELITKEDARKYLEENNNYFKLASYRKNFPKYENGTNKDKYIDLDFEMLKDLAIIDMRIRKTMLSIVLDLEHYVKVKLLSKIECKTKDGYTIVEEYIQELKEKKKYEYLEQELNKNIKGTYCGELVTKYHEEYPVWVFLEIIPFGRLIHFYRFVAKKIGDKKMIDESYMLMDVRELRNACAHNNCIINDLKAGTSEHIANYNIKNSISQIGISKKVRDNKLSNTRMRQLVTLLYLNKSITTSEGIFKHQCELLNDLKERIKYHLDYYKTNELILTNFNFFIKIIDNWYISKI